MTTPLNIDHSTDWEHCRGINSCDIFFFNLIIELIPCDLLCLSARAFVRYYETKLKEVVPAVAS